MHSQEVLIVVTPAEAGVQKSPKILDSRLRGNDRKRRFLTFYESIKFNDFDFLLQPSFFIIRPARYAL